MVDEMRTMLDGPGITSSVLGAIGRTPLIPLRRIAGDVPATILVKLESVNPGGSIKDRVGVATAR